jgi:hypothetical protein
MTHQFGSTRIQVRPERIVALGRGDADALLALGVPPVAILDWFKAWPQGVGPWAQPRLGGAVPELLTGPQLGIDRVATIAPDLVTFVRSDGARASWQRLNELAPTISGPRAAQPYGTTWQDQMMTVAGAIVRGRAGYSRAARGHHGGICSRQPSVSVMSSGRGVLKAMFFAAGMHPSHRSRPPVFAPDSPRIPCLFLRGYAEPIPVGVFLSSPARNDFPAVPGDAFPAGPSRNDDPGTGRRFLTRSGRSGRSGRRVARVAPGRSGRSGRRLAGSSARLGLGHDRRSRPARAGSGSTGSGTTGSSSTGSGSTGSGSTGSDPMAFGPAGSGGAGADADGSDPADSHKVDAAARAGADGDLNSSARRWNAAAALAVLPYSRLSFRACRCATPHSRCLSCSRRNCSASAE